MTIAGVIVLLLNDHLLKQVSPGFVTGKLSDVAGLVVAPALVALLFGRRADLAATVLTGVLFTLVKTTGTGADLASQTWTLVAGHSRVLADPTDLIALPALALAWWVRRRSAESDPRRLRILLVMPLAVLSVAATGAAPPPLSADSVEIDDTGRVVVHLSSDSLSSRVSDDGGLTWTNAPLPRTKPTMGAQCVPGEASRCYRVAQGRPGVEQSDDYGKTWTPAWRPSSDDQYATEADVDSTVDSGRTMGLVVQDRDEGHIVVVANGPDGIVVRDTSGKWRRLGWAYSASEAAPERALPPDVSSERNMAFFLATCLLLGGIGAGLRRLHHLYSGFAVATALGLSAAFDIGGWSRLLSARGELAMTMIGFVVAVLAAFVCLTLAFAGRTRGVTAAVAVGAAPTLYAAVYLPFQGWSTGSIGSYGVAVTLAAALGLLVVGAGVALIRNDARRADPLTGPDT
ncbi:MAG: hypothetical protein HOW71_23970 [Nonomuraea sp.]|nr:hypothetical protein [Nonomuraea sp.]NUS07444.1 hypothetical protein [Nonomuraea sp.]